MTAPAESESPGAEPENLVCRLVVRTTHR